MDNSTNQNNKNKPKQLVASVLNILRLSAVLVSAVAIISIVYGSIMHSCFWPFYIFTANLAVGAFVILAGIVLFAWPTMLKKSKLIDISNHAEMHLEAKARKREKAYLLIYTGIGGVIITVLAQYILSLVWR
ncbi:MAG: hypothetical protein FWE34_07010 [Defluviitaleaceae bacterium]|nr:hypothetical protein [Defluviitaleaceae bacterium]